ncbi:hypothetical protein HPB52_003950 [Rhipicephalus sanguineus]|uniref:Uncharacterized protein n=1 Tax=Rhipicephalus sanguineus TaxID=34632 RepID=A0A9D4ST92_RHISA|nr:hypothetical protein HPB52_003950 [Rhipicephalus sanguineus]
MAPRKRRKAYLDPGSVSRMPKSTKWLLDHPRDGAARAPRAHVPSPIASTRSSSTSPVKTRVDQICNESEHLDSTSEEDSDEDCSDFTDSEYANSDASVTPPASPFPASEDCFPTDNSAGPSCDPEGTDAYLCDPIIDGGTLTRARRSETAEDFRGLPAYLSSAKTSRARLPRQQTRSKRRRESSSDVDTVEAAPTLCTSPSDTATAEKNTANEGTEVTKNVEVARQTTEPYAVPRSFKSWKHTFVAWNGDFSATS